MALSSIDPSSGEVLESFAETAPAALESSLARAWQVFPGWRARLAGLPRLARALIRGARGAPPRSGPAAARPQGGLRAPHGARDGEAGDAGRGRGGEVRLVLRVLR